MAHNPATNFGWVITGNEVDAGAAQRFNSRENPSNPPRLTITFTTATPTPTPISIAGNVSNCAAPATTPVANVTLNLTGSMTGSAMTDASGNYMLAGLASGGTYTVTPTKPALTPGTAGINTVDVIAIQRHFLQIVALTGCRLTAADASGDNDVTTVDVIAVQRFFLNQTTGIANVGKYNFTPANRTYPAVTNDQTAQNYDAIVFGDVATPFVP